MKTAATISVLALLPLAGCRVSENARLTVGQDVHIEAIEPGPAGSGSIVPALDSERLTEAAGGFVEEDEIPGRDVVLLAPVPEASLATIDRAAWNRQAFFVPVDHTFHRPTYTYDLDYLPRGEHPPEAYPTALAAIAVPSGGIRDQVVETVATPFIAAANSLLIVPWLFVQPPWTLDHSPERPYERYWEQRPVERDEAATDAPPAVSPTETEVDTVPGLEAAPVEEGGPTDVDGLSDEELR